MGRLLAVSTLLASSPSATDSQVTASAIPVRTPQAATHSTGVAVGRKPMSSFMLSWLSVALGLLAKSVETASNLPMPLILLPFLGSGFVPTESMPTAMRWFAEYQPFTAIMETLRGLLLGTAIGSDGIVAVVWCAAVTAGAYVWAKALYDRDPSA